MPVYIFVLDPLARSWAPESLRELGWSAGLDPDAHDLAESDGGYTPSTLHLTDDSFISPDDGVPAHCPGEADGYRVHLLSRTPLILYIENFVSEQEADHLMTMRYVPPVLGFASGNEVLRVGLFGECEG